jgi:hypothetical protein
MRRGLLLALLLLAAPAAAQETEPQAQADRLMRIFVEQGLGAFLDTVLSETVLGADTNARRSIEDSRPRWAREIEAFGTMIDAVAAGERHYAPVFRTVCYVVRFRRVPLFVHLRFYRTPERWNLLTFGWHDNVLNWECADGVPLTPRQR